MNENKWLCFNDKFIRKSAICEYHLINLTIEIYTSFVSYNQTFETEEQANKWLNYLHNELREN